MKRKNMIKGIIVISMLFILPAITYAEMVLKIAYVDTQRVLEECVSGKKAKKDLEEYLKKEQAKIDSKESEIKKLQKELEDNIMLNEEGKKEKEALINQKFQEYKEFAGEAKQMLDNKQKDIIKPIVKEINDIIKKIGIEEGYSVIFEKNYSYLLYYSPELELTDKIIKRIDEKRQ
ncbi:MAG: OmpH family outer membrane protein [Candidatus Firestonebacteria bacterium]|nr:OmpH family outer membrane protein [Candidatus Firestonebacteria bacterium]